MNWEFVKFNRSVIICLFNFFTKQCLFSVVLNGATGFNDC